MFYILDNYFLVFAFYDITNYDFLLDLYLYLMLIYESLKSHKKIVSAGTIEAKILVHGGLKKPHLV